ncbi:MAG TPA: hypothetical protein VMY88_08415 [Acidimicrobiales bacterium]|nr:hypothetical protein [Acidimicrobiales bacterium]
MTVIEQTAAAAHNADLDALEPGEGLDVEERLIVAPAVGIFRPLELNDAEVSRGQAIGVVESVGAEPRTVHSPHAGWLKGLLAKGGERVRAGQPVAWLRAIA